MPNEIIGLIGIILVFVLIFLRVPIVISMLTVSFLGISYLLGVHTLSAAISSILWNQSTSYLLSTIPMFVLMGEFLFASGISNEVFDMFRKLFGRVRGGLAISTIGASAMFAASSGSSVATTGTMGVIAYKEMEKSSYNKNFASGAIVSGGTLGLLIPPSTLFIIYGMLTEQSIGKLLIAGIVPGIVLTILLMLTVVVSVLLNPKLAPKGEPVAFIEKLKSFKSIFWIALVFIVVIGGMYIGLFSPTEAAGIGAMSTFLVALLRRKMTKDIFVGALRRTLSTTGFIFAILLGAYVLNYFLAITKVPVLLANLLTSISSNSLIILLLIILMYILLGAIMDATAMIVITMPIVIPIIQALGYDLIWFGVLICLVVELGLITPPIGMNCFVLKGAVPVLKLEDIFKGALRFCIPILVLVILLIIFPEIALYLPNRMMGS